MNMNDHSLSEGLAHDYFIGRIHLEGDKNSFCVIDLKEKHLYSPTTYEDIVDVLKGIVDNNDVNNISNILRPSFYVLPSTSENYIHHIHMGEEEILYEQEVSPSQLDVFSPSQLKELYNWYRQRIGVEFDIRSKEMGEVLLPEYSPLERNNFIDGIPLDYDVTSKGIEQKILAYRLYNKELKHSN